MFTFQRRLLFVEGLPRCFLVLFEKCSGCKMVLVPDRMYKGLRPEFRGYTRDSKQLIALLADDLADLTGDGGILYHRSCFLSDCPHVALCYSVHVVGIGHGSLNADMVFLAPVAD
jgi:hypothetical protein